MTIALREKIARGASVLALCLVLPQDLRARVAHAHHRNTKPTSIPRLVGSSASPQGSPQRNQARPLPASQPETIQVAANVTRSANGVTNTTPGGGLMAVQTAPKSKSTVTRDYIAKQAATTSPISLITSLPGVVSANVDPLGQSTGNMSIRGLSETEIGFVYEDLPTAQPISYTPHIQQFVDNENIRSVTVTQGSPDMATPVYNAVGGMVSVALTHARSRAGGTVNVAFGSKSLQHEFIRLDSGEWGHSGVKSFASFSSTTNNQWRGAGTFKKYHVDAEVRKDWTADTSLALIFSYDNWNQSNYRNPNMAEWKEYGVGYNYPEQYYPGNTDWLNLQKTIFHNYSVMIPFKSRLADGLSFHFTPNYVRNDSWLDGGLNISNASSYHGNRPAGDLNLPGRFGGGLYGTVQTISPTTYQVFSLDTGIAWEHAFNTLKFGYSYNYVDQSVMMYFAGVSSNGAISSQPVTLASGERLTDIDQHFQQQMNSLYFEDQMSFFEKRLKISAGIKYLMISRDQVNNTPGAIRYGSGTYSQPLPQVSVSYKISPHDQIYIDGTTAYRAPASIYAYGQIFEPIAPVALTSYTKLNGEYAISEEIGFRHYGLINFSAALFNYNITNNQVYTSTQVGSVFLPRVLQYGGKTSRGIQGELGLRPWHHFSPYVSGQYLHATMDTDYAATNSSGKLVYLPTAGKIAVQTPKFTAAIGLAYDDGHFFGNFNFNYIGSQYSTFMDDEKIPSYTLENITLGYRMNNVWYLKRPQFQLNINNVGARNYLSGISSVTPNAKTYKGVPGSAPLYMIGGGVAVIAALTTGF